MNWVSFIKENKKAVIGVASALSAAGCYFLWQYYDNNYNDMDELWEDVLYGLKEAGIWLIETLFM